jgi:hypothetical protein
VFANLIYESQLSRPTSSRQVTPTPRSGVNYAARHAFVSHAHSVALADIPPRLIARADEVIEEAPPPCYSA